MVTFKLMTDEEIEAARQNPMPDDYYEEPCGECGGKVIATAGRHHYNGHYDCYTLYLKCENCGPYEVECV